MEMRGSPYPTHAWCTINFDYSLSVADVDWEVGAPHNRGVAASLPQGMEGMHQLQGTMKIHAEWMS